MTLPSSTEKNHAAARLSIMFNNTTTALAVPKLRAGTTFMEFCNKQRSLEMQDLNNLKRSVRQPSRIKKQQITSRLIIFFCLSQYNDETDIASCILQTPVNGA